MALYLGGNEKLKITLNGIAHSLNLCVKVPVVNDISLLSSDNYVLRDSNGLYLIPNDYVYNIMSSDSYILKDLNNLYLTTKRSG